MRVQKTVFWTDSTLLEQYIASTEKRFRPFVANRVSIIRQMSSPSQWRHVPTLLNPADDATRILSTSELTHRSKWLSGPLFLRVEEGEWPEKLSLIDAAMTYDPEVISCSAMANAKGPAGNGENKNSVVKIMDALFLVALAAKGRGMD